MTHAARQLVYIVHPVYCSVARACALELIITFLKCIRLCNDTGITYVHVVNLHDDILYSLDNHKSITLVLLDLSAAFVTVVCCLLSAVCCLLSAVCCLLSAVCCLLSTVCCMLSCLLSAVCCLLSAVCCLLSAVRCMLLDQLHRISIRESALRWMKSYLCQRIHAGCASRIRYFTE